MHCERLPAASCPTWHMRTGLRATLVLLAGWCAGAVAATSLPSDAPFFDPFEGALQSIDVACGAGVTGDTIPCTATATYTSGAQLDISGDVAWATSDETVGSVIDSYGDVAAAGAGQCTITAASGVVQGMTTLNVGVPLQVQSTQPADAATNVATPRDLAITFNSAFDPSTLTAQTISGACSGSIQLSANGFASCLAFAAASPVIGGANTIASLTPMPAWSFGTTYKLKVTTAVKAAGGSPLAAEFTMPAGFTTILDTPCSNGVVISQVYSAGGNGGASYDSDYVELHNKGSTTAVLTNWAIQYAAGTGSTWSITPLSGSIAPGGYFLVKEATGAGAGDALPTPDVAGVIAMGATAGKVALTSGTSALSGSCPAGGTIVDFVGYGAANCAEGAGPASAPSTTSAILRKRDGCLDSNTNVLDFDLLAAAPRNAASPAQLCACSLNESGTPAEADYCVLQFPQSLSVGAGLSTSPIYAQVYEGGVTAAPGPDAAVTAQIGYGPTTANPENQGGWQWSAAAYNAQIGNNDEYVTTLVAPAQPGSYRYGARISFDGANWTYCDGDGAGSNPNLLFAPEQLGVMTVTP